MDSLNSRLADLFFSKEIDNGVMKALEPSNHRCLQFALSFLLEIKKGKYFSKKSARIKPQLNIYLALKIISFFKGTISCKFDLTSVF